jgi:CxxC motif-containing protein (DUF1111 family)
MNRADRFRLRRIAAFSVFVVTALPALEARAAAPAAVPEATLAQGRELFTRAWIPRDRRSHGGDGLGPVYNERSCLGCHHLGGPGGAAGADKNIEIISANGDALTIPGAFYSFGMSFGGAGFQYRFASNTKPVQPQPPNPADLAQIHAGFHETPSVVLHRFGPDADYRTWRERIPGPHGSIFIRSSQRNPAPLFGAGLIDAIPDEIIEAAARRRFPGWPQVKGRVSRLSDGRIGRFGWKAQTATLEDFVVNAAAVELGLEVPGRPQAGDPRIPPLAAPGLDMDRDDCNALVAYVRSLPEPGIGDPANPKEAVQIKAGGAVFKSIGCATCHLPKLGDVEGIYSDLLLHDMSPQLADTSFYGVFAAPAPAGARPAAPAEGAGPDRKPRPSAAVQEWRTPPLWGLRDSGPYLHDGRAATLDQAIRGHGGQATAAGQKYLQLSAREHAQIEAFLLSLAAPRVAE